MISEFPLFVFTSLGGLAAGMAVAMAFFPTREKLERAWVGPLVALALLGVGLLGVLFHLGRPHMFFLGLRNLSAGIAQEAYCSIAFGITLLAQLCCTWKKKEVPSALKWLTAFFGLLMAFIMGFAYLANAGTPAWSDWTTVPLFVAGDLAIGFALWGALISRFDEKRFLVAELVMVLLAALCMVLTGMHFAQVGFSPVPFYVACAIEIVSAIALFVGKATKVDGRAFAVLSAFIIVGVLVSRWFFYAASIV